MGFPDIQEGIRSITRAMIDSTGNLQPIDEIWPDRMAPIVRNTPAWLSRGEGTSLMQHA
ncbi:hypothetical protein [Rhizobium mongolense]